eukprot:TRINITY_DN7262_c0_g1_i5.p2 TRINITY_DN7262_c0_g1~~TRINITY_DN7262_c0_g1_i5.p2  ORF type:complete len:136 (+),score=31.09 TRINITY_DN7262_c0_g1_i5:391-798(+)
MFNVLEILNSGEIELPKEEQRKVMEYLKACQHPEGGFSGAPFMEAHVASTYSALCAIVQLGTEEAYQIVNREKTLQYLLRLKHNKDDPVAPSTECSKTRTTRPGSFEINVNGENDMRSHVPVSYTHLTLPTTPYV